MDLVDFDLTIKWQRILWINGQMQLNGRIIYLNGKISG